MRIIILIILLPFFAILAKAQSAAADPNAIDFSAQMDTIARGNANLLLGNFLNVNLKNDDVWQDFELTSSNTRMRFGGNLIFDTSNNPLFARGAYLPQLYGDFDGDDIGDIYSEGAFFKGMKDYPYYDSDITIQLMFPGNTEDAIGSIDFDEDGQIDFLVQGNRGSNNYILFFKGGSSFGTTSFKYADDSLIIPRPKNYYLYTMIAGKFGVNLKPMVLYTEGQKTYLVIQSTNKLSGDTAIVISDSALGGITATNLYAMDITGDGITDLIVSDRYHIYIFKGGDDFGTYQLTPKNAYYTIQSPRLLDFDTYGFIDDFGIYMRNVGDLTGSGTPYLAVDGEASSSTGYYKAFTFFYAGGKALDSLYDAVIGYEENGGYIMYDTLHSINSTGRTVVLVNDGADVNNFYDLDFLMSRECENIPHVTNPSLMSVQEQATNFQQTTMRAQAGAGFVRLKIAGGNLGASSLRIFDLAGRMIAEREVAIYGSDIEEFTTTSYADGTYFAELMSNGAVQAATKFPVSRALYDVTPESPVTMMPYENNNTNSSGGMMRQ